MILYTKHTEVEGSWNEEISKDIAVKFSLDNATTSLMGWQGTGSFQKQGK